MQGDQVLGALVRCTVWNHVGGAGQRAGVRRKGFRCGQGRGTGGGGPGNTAVIQDGKGAHVQNKRCALQPGARERALPG